MKLKIETKDSNIDKISIKLLKHKLDLQSKYHNVVMDNCSYQYYHDKSSDNVYDFPTHIKLDVKDGDIKKMLNLSIKPLHVNKYVYESCKYGYAC